MKVYEIIYPALRTVNLSVRTDLLINRYNSFSPGKLLYNLLEKIISHARQVYAGKRKEQKKKKKNNTVLEEKEKARRYERNRFVSAAPCEFRGRKRKGAEHLSGPDGARPATTEAYGRPPRAQTERGPPDPAYAR